MSRKITDGTTQWQRYRSRHLPYVERPCTECGERFHPHGPQRRCLKCRTQICPECGTSFLVNRAARKFCSRSCLALAHIETLHANRGVKPRTYHLRHRDKHGSAADREWRKAVFERDNYTCRECGTRGGRLNAHHVKSFKGHPGLRHEIANGLTLCVPCHKKTDTFGWQSYWKSEIAAKRLAQGVLDLQGVAL